MQSKFYYENNLLLKKILTIININENTFSRIKMQMEK